MAYTLITKPKKINGQLELSYLVADFEGSLQIELSIFIAKNI